MHDGSVRTLEEVVEFYTRGGRPNPHLDPSVHPLSLSAEDKRALVKFLEALTSTR
jgi:cytochrome c peroxidase